MPLGIEGYSWSVILLMAALLKSFNGSYIPIAMYIIFTGIISLIAIRAADDYAGKPLDD
ncbi:hypothetical protein [Rappaport israeli]|uniref:hypothetical protein n=1 Tax=Rappaport israeli TaxID=1839807 RepID=UPI0013017758|nr:hypothetical protein [Rappaport israeli]